MPPRVPRLAAPQVDLAPLPGPSIAQTGAGQALAQAGASIAKSAEAVYTQARERATQVALLDAENQLAAFETQRLYDPRDGALAKKGKDAFDLAAGIRADYARLAGDLERGLGTPEARTRFRALAQSRGVQIDRTVQRHVAQELTAYDTAATTAALANAQNAAAMNYTMPDRIAAEAGRVRTIVVEHGRRQGLPAEAVQQGLATETSTLHVGVLNRMLAAGEDRLASIYYAEVKDQLTGAHAATIEKAVGEGSLRGQAQRLTDVLTARIQTGDLATRDAVLEAARSLAGDDPKLRDAVEQRGMQAWSDHRESERQAQADTFEAIIDRLDLNGGNLDAVPLEQFLGLSAQQQTSVRQYARTRRQGEDPVTDLAVYYDLLTQAATPALQAKFLKTNLLEYANDLSRADRMKLMGLQASLRAKDGKAEAAVTGYRTDAQIVNDSLAAVGIDPTPKPGTGPAKEVAAFRRRVDEAIADHGARTGKRPTTADVQAIVDDLLARGRESGTGWFGTDWFARTPRRFEATPGTPFVVEDVAEVPAAWRTRMEQALRRRGIRVSDDRLVDLYNQYLHEPGGAR